jgi:hypothetical protein
MLTARYLEDDELFSAALPQVCRAALNMLLFNDFALYRRRL